MQIQPNIHHISGKWSNLYLCAEPEHLILVDAGMPGDHRNLFDYIRSIGRQISDLKHILITHADIDHVGSLAEIQARTGAMIYAGKETAVFLQQGTSPPHGSRLKQLLMQPLSRYQPLPAESIHVIENGETLPYLDGIQSIASPGHTGDHFSFYSRPKGVLFAGDALSTRNGRIQLSPNFITADKAVAAQSAIQLLSLTPATVACGHGNPISDHDSDKIMAFFNTLRH